MALRDVIIYPHSALRLQALPVTSFGEELHQLLDDMRETMYHSQGIGLAGNQVNVVQQVVVIDVSEARDEPIEVVNPQIVETFGSVKSSEGCLSIPDYRDTIKRHEKVTLRALNRFGEEYTLEAEGMLAICIQHEIDHLRGVLFTDHLSFLKQQFFKKWCKKNLSDYSSE